MVCVCAKLSQFRMDEGGRNEPRVEEEPWGVAHKLYAFRTPDDSLAGNIVGRPWNRMCRVLVSRSLACRTMWIAEGLPEPRKNVNVGSAHECGKRTAGPYRVVFEHTCDRDRSGMPFPPAILKTHRVFPRSLTSVWAHSWPIRRTTPQNTSSLGFTSHHMCVCACEPRT